VKITQIGGSLINDYLAYNEISQVSNFGRMQSWYISEKITLWYRELYSAFDTYVTHMYQKVHIRPPCHHHWHLSTWPTVAVKRIRIHCQMSVVRTWQLVSRRRLLHIVGHCQLPCTSMGGSLCSTILCTVRIRAPNSPIKRLPSAFLNPFV